VVSKGVRITNCILFTTLIAFLQKTAGNIMLLPVIASITTIIHFIGKAKATPVMLSIKKTPNDEMILKKKFDQFEKWNGLRACFQFITFILLLYGFAINRY
jgi:hypothetical protein